MLDPDFVADCPYAPEALLFDAILELEREGELAHESDRGAVWRRV